MKLASLFSGIGGFDIAARAVGWETVWYSEIEPYANAVMTRRWPGVPNHGDIRSINGRAVEYADVLTGGFPCQDISLNGAGAGLDGERSGLWSHFARIIDEGRPRWVVAENVAALRSRGLDRVLRDFAALGYDAEWHCIPASAAGADHERDRIWIIANAAGLRVEGLWPQGFQVARSLDQALLSVRDRDGQWKVEPDLRRAADGVPRWMDRVRCLGNAVVPHVAAAIFEAIIRYEGHNNT